jgi:hypothetical protein
MTQSSGFFDPGGYTRAQIAAAFARFLGNGVAPGVGGALLVYQHTSPNMSVNVATGGMEIEGYWHDSDAVANLVIEAADVSNPRIDRIVARLTTTGSPGSIVLAVRKGTAQTPAVAPVPTWTSPTYELVLADIAVAVGTTAITTAMITSQRNNDLLCGVARPRAVGKRAYADVWMDGWKLTSLANPVSAQDADTMAARDAALLVKVPSQTGKTGMFLTTNGTVTSWAAQGGFFQAIASDTLVKSSDASVAITDGAYTIKKSASTPIVHLPNGTYRVKFSLYAYGNTNEHVYGKIYLGGIPVGTERHLQADGGAGTTVVYSEDITVTSIGGTAIQVYCYHTGGQTAAVSNFRIYCTEAIPWT